MAEKKEIPQKTIINASTIIGSAYSQLASVTVTNIDMTIEFIFINPRDPSSGQVVSRVTLPKKVGLKLAEVIVNTNKINEKRRSEKK
ncbi:hypothetical protein A2697_04695 [Candidatus Curtissbacteria bacterium RIFCSPHIGHO2_01_FULL_41_44]|uniref:Uncharacterized protein n=1 Tax=Candidatus Curtissbacteria bacterium RIFCSPLOWO2_01_FULL_42_50 TaxID=1797730 RepID=A0A1F5H2J8_9BACT|nr:MAG: hypothetical protein A3C33_01800 [Candidatus Curtissbacteria bacterium RIFCSPHIGHO2_02_FULL_42_58]OGD94790.1 MAG: hypothetical protein A2697_04695 [Candidatus Curtissbacteria bacterium RIFCSPHIGHO2_01_FULL_41_44]OGD96333.1 MAG: hypothetical protein A3E71_02155 [Candidatus Curtissbacteria bacterium RIFCSPHIGHO2_12_FULL_42_33]OGD98353.1 MAG: hypothetical protein A3B54_00675 [Candidatus Curtissbacteria bacterium RIFCSPLOWO2_01_FULL_42_50]OGE02990.1 MAG: hypothetical protein A3G16_04665 [Ca